MRNLLLKFSILFVMLFSIQNNANAHTIELRAVLNSDGSATFYARSYHLLTSVSGGFIVDGVTYPFQGVFNQASLPANTTLISVCNYAFATTDVYQYVTVPNFNSCITHTYDCTTAAPEAPWCPLSASLNLSNPVVTIQPVFVNNGYACLNSTETLSVTATNGQTYQWQINTGAGFVNLVDNSTYMGSTTTSLMIMGVSTAMAGYQYRCIASKTDNCGNTSSATSNAATLNIGYAPSITTQPVANINIAPSGAGSVSVSVTGTLPTYQWMLSTDGGTSYNPISGATSSSYLISGVSVGMNGYKYRCSITGSCGSVMSTVSTLAVNASPTTTTLSPVSICANTTSNTQNFTISDLETSAANLMVMATSSNQTLLPDANILLGGSGSTRTISMTPAAGQSGTATVTVSVMDAGGATTTTSFLFTSSLPKFTGSTGVVNAVNLGGQVAVDSAIVVNETTNVNGAKVSITSNLNSGDLLATTGTLPAGVTSSYVASTGILSISGTMTPSQLQTILQGVKFSTTSAVSGNRIVTFTLGTATPSTNGHYYEYVAFSGSWTSAKANAATRSYLGLQGYLATVGSATENAFIVSKISGDAWFGASDDYLQINAATGTTTFANQAAAEGQWYWVTGPEAGQKFSVGNMSPVTQPGMYANWGGVEPNNSGSSEHYGQYYSSGGGQWNDLPNSSILNGYVCEYGGMNTDGCTNISSTRTINVITNLAPTITAVANITQCAGIPNSVTTTIADDRTPIANLVFTATSSNTALIPNSGITITGAATKTISFTPILTQSGTATITLTCTDANAATTTSTFVVTVNATPLLTSTLTPTVICNGGVFSYTPVSTLGGASISWIRPTISGLTQSSASGVGAINETLNNTTTSILSVPYTIAMSFNGCSYTQIVTATVNPLPVLSSSLTPASICNNATFTYTSTSATAGATFSWTRATVSGISNSAGSGTGSISEVLTNITANAINVVYAVTTSIAGCTSNTQNVTVSVQPSPTLSTTLNPNPACSGSPFSYVPNSATTTITAAGWTRAAVTGISNAAASSASGIINETLVNTTPAPITVNYVYNLAIGSCTNSQTVNVVVNPRPLLSSAFTATTCNNTLFTYTPTSATTGTTYAWSRAAVTGISNAAATGSGAVNETLINTTSAPINVTYVYTLTANGCSNNQNVVLTVYPTPVLSSSLTPSAVCSNAPFAYTPTSATSGTTYSWTRAAVTGISNLAASGTGAINETLINTTLTPVTVSYLITSTANGCSNTETITVVINPMPTLTSGLTVNALCNVSPLFYIASSGTPGTTFAWSRAAVAGISNAAATGAGNIIETLNNTSANPITVNYVYTSTANGCSNPQTVSVVINPTPTLSSTQTAAPVCNNTLFNYAATSATSGTTFTWSRAAVTGISNAAATGTGANISETLINTTSAPRTVTYVFTLTANNCTNTQNVSVVVNPTALLSSTLTPASICTNTTFAYTPTSATTGTTYTWSRAALTGISNAAATGTAGISEVLINTTPNPITVNYVYTLTANNCTNPTSQTVAVVVKPTPVLTSTLTPAAQCNAQSFNYTATSATAGTTYTWSRAAVAGITPATGSGNSGFILENLVNNTANPLTVNYVVNLLANGCANTQNFSLTINSTPVLSSTLNAAPICNATAFAYTPTSNTTGTTFAWSRAAVAGISNAAATGTGDINETLNNTTQTPLIVSYIYTLTANGCTNTQTVKVTVNPTPALTSLLTRFTCDNTVFNYTPTSATAGTTYTWSRSAVAGISNASASGNGVISETLLNTTNTPVTTTYVLTLTANGCTNTQSVDVTVNPTPQLSSSLTTTPICSNTNFTYAPSATVSGTSFAWTRATVAGISNAAGTGFGSINEALINTTPNPVTVNYVYVLTANNCSNIQNFNVTVNPSPVLTSSLAPTGVCSNTPFAYSPTSATAGTTYSWTRATINGISNAAANGTGAINETLVNTTSAIASPKYLVTLTANGCSNTQFVQASIFPTPALSSGLSIAPVCSGVETNYIPASATSGTTYSWSRAAVTGISNAAATGTGNIKETLTNTGNAPVAVNYVYTLTANTCTNTQTVATTINPKPATPTITALGPTTFCVEESVDLQVPSLTGGTYNWFLNGSNLGVNAATATVNIEGAYTASVTNQYGCTSAISSSISISTPCSSGVSGMPTVFTPNGDGENDELFAVIPGIKELNKFSIYNRWGNMVFDTKIIGTAWDGKFKDLDQPADVYFWYIEGVDSNGTVHKKQGKVVLAR
jgi:gliding motility-associated-like protein